MAGVPEYIKGKKLGLAERVCFQPAGPSKMRHPEVREIGDPYAMRFQIRAIYGLAFRSGLRWSTIVGVATHHPCVCDHRKSFARLSKDAGTKTCIVFVHGFFGNARTTWQHFAELCDTGATTGSALLDRSDLYFFDYPAQSGFVKASAHELSTFLGRVFPTPDMKLFFYEDACRAAIRNSWTPYTKVVLVGHSLGAVVIRECVENQFRLPGELTPANWVQACEVRLFGAAHLGFQPSGWKDFVFEALPSALTSFPKIWRAFNDLRQDSTTLRDLRNRTQLLASSRPSATCFRAHLLYGTKEAVVIPGEFDCDYRIRWLEGLNHTQVCKPTQNFREPIGFVGDERSTPANA